jgi:hypothetical protein
MNPEVIAGLPFCRHACPEPDSSARLHTEASQTEVGRDAPPHLEPPSVTQSEEREPKTIPRVDRSKPEHLHGAGG